MPTDRPLMDDPRGSVMMGQEVGDSNPPARRRSMMGRSREKRPRPPASERRRLFHYRGHRVEKVQAGWSIWLGNREVGWGSTKTGAKRTIDEMLESKQLEP